MSKGKTKKSVEAGVDYSKVIGVGLGVIGLVVVALLIVILAKTLRDEKKYMISYHSDDKLAPQIVEGDELPTSAVIVDEGIVVDTSKYITVEKALDAALKSAGLTREQVRDIDVELERKFGQMVFEVSFDAGQYEYEYYVNAESGEIVKSFKGLD
ncbi:PepSY domain-containing protein [Candidatus Saccharibacteria bacterium]|nr:PepSY domain-containing protein [Candidatus Saccharibacteria bacterium]